MMSVISGHDICIEIPVLTILVLIFDFKKLSI